MTVRSTLVVAIAAIFASTAFAQPDTIPEAVLLYKLERTAPTTFETRVRTLLAQIDLPPGERLFILAYSPPNAVAKAKGIRPTIDRLVAASKFSGSQVRVLMSEATDKDEAEFYIVPAGAAPPEPRREVLLGKDLIPEETGVIEEFVDRVRLNRMLEEEFDRDESKFEPTVIASEDPIPVPIPLIENSSRPVAEDGDLTSTDETIDGSPLDREVYLRIRYSWTNKRLGPAIAARKAGRGVMIFYADDEFYDIARLEVFILEGRDRIAKAAGIDPDLIEVVFGGYRARVSIDSWLITEGGRTPEPTPERRDPGVEPSL